MASCSNFDADDCYVNSRCGTSGVCEHIDGFDDGRGVEMCNITGEKVLCVKKGAIKLQCQRLAAQ